MAKKDQYNDPKKPNLKVLVDFRHKGKAIRKGAIITKASIEPKSVWQNLVHMKNPRVEETDEKVKDAPKPKAAVKPKEGMPGA